MADEKNPAIVSAKIIPLLRRPYAERQLIVVVPDAVLDAERKARAPKGKSKTSTTGIANGERTPANWTTIAGTTLEILATMSVPLVTIAPLVGAATALVITAMGNLRESGINVVSVGQKEAAKLSFPVGHPRLGVLYIGHPAEPTTYFTMAQFHRLTFEHKFSEAVHLLMALGAKEISVEHESGWTSKFASSLSAPLPSVPGGSVGASAGTEKNHVSQLLFHAVLNPKGQPAVPNDLVWYRYEPTWKQVAEGRLNHGLRTFRLVVSYVDDFGVNAGLKVACAKVGLELGGSFENHESTVWRFQGTFAD